MPGQTSSESQRPSSLACIPCRNKHLKCDAKAPLCTRCQKQGISCSYVRSRRGLRPFKALHDHPVNAADHNSGNLGELLSGAVEAQLSNTQCSEAPDETFPMSSPLDTPMVGEESLWNGEPNTTINPDVLTNLNQPGPSDLQSLGFATYGSSHLALQSLRLPHTTLTGESYGDGMFIDLFYTHFYPAHPFVIPQKLLQQQKVALPGHLRDAIIFIGSHFAQTTPSSASRGAALKVLYSEGPVDGFRVQALLLLSLVFHARFEEVDCLAALRQASELATQLRMFDANYASVNDFGIPTVAESWRRTWWELLALDVLLPTFHPRQYEPCLQDIKTNIYLPGEEYDYISCRPSQTMKAQQEFCERLFREDNYKYSSFAYKIEAVRLLNVVRQFSSDDSSGCPQSVDSSLTNFFLSLPESKREVVGMDGTVDEVLFSAHAIANVASLLFHRSQSTFAYMIQRQPTQCTTQECPKSMVTASPRHTSKALAAADRLSNAVGAHLAIKRRSPFLTCAIALAASIHLPAYMSPCYMKDRPTLKERLQLNISALQMIGEVWMVAQVVKAQISKFACEVLLDNGCNAPQTLELELQGVQTRSVVSDDSWLDHLSGTGEPP